MYEGEGRYIKDQLYCIVLEFEMQAWNTDTGLNSRLFIAVFHYFLQICFISSCKWQFGTQPRKQHCGCRTYARACT